MSVTKSISSHSGNHARSGENFSYPTSALYWLLIPLLLLLQIALSYQTRFQYRYEDISINVISVYYFIHHAIFAVSTYYAWYALLHALYSLFGFSINIVMVLRIVIDFFGLLSTAILLKKYLGTKKAILPFLVIGISPTFTYFMTSSAPYGIEIQLLPIYLLLLDSLDFRRKWQPIILEILLWGFVMMGLLTYATVNIFVPFLGILYLAKMKRLYDKKQFGKIALHLFISFVVFVIPIFVGLAYFNNVNNLFGDVHISRLGGLFESASTIVFQSDFFTQAMSGTFNDLFANGHSYYYQLQNGEFSYVFPVIPLLLVLIGSVILALHKQTDKKLKALVLLCFIMIVGNILLTGISYDLSHMPGVRRNTPALAAFYILFAIVWARLLSWQTKKKGLRILMLICLLLLPLHHLLVLPDNYRHLSDPSIFTNYHRFDNGKDPQEALSKDLTTLQKTDIHMGCELTQEREFNPCHYLPLYATLQLACKYNHLSCKDVYGYDNVTQKYIKLSFDLFAGDDYPDFH